VRRLATSSPPEYMGRMNNSMVGLGAKRVTCDPGETCNSYPAETSYGNE
jgi:hypothetical protein